MGQIPRIAYEDCSRPIKRVRRSKTFPSMLQRCELGGVKCLVTALWRLAL